MRFEVWGVRIAVCYPFLAVLTLFLTLDRTGLGGQMFCAALLHELGHLAVMYRLGRPPSSIDFLPFGIRIERPGDLAPSYSGEIAVFLAGPAVNLAAAGLSAALSGGISRLALVHLSLGLFNLLPIGPLDGGRVLESTVRYMAGPRTARRVSQAVSLAFLALVAAASAGLLRQGKGNVTMIVASVYLAATLAAGRKD